MADLRTFDLNLLVALDALIAERSVSAAARRVGIGQPAMSHALARLRDLFGDRLLVRAGSVMNPTARALELAGPVARVLQDIRVGVLADQVFRPEREARVFRIGASDYVMAALLPKLLTLLQTAAPRCQLAVGPVSRDDVAARLAAGALDLAIGYYPESNSPLRGAILFHEHHVCLFDAGACGVTPPISLDDYAALPHFLVSSRLDFAGVIDTGMAELGRERFVLLSTSSFLAIPFLLRGLRAVAVVPARLAHGCHDAIGLTVSPPPLRIDGFDVSVLWHLRSDSDPCQVWFRDRVRDAVAASAVETL